MERAESAAEAPRGPEAIRWTGDNDEAVQGFLGSRFEGIRGGLQDDDPRVLWFRSGVVIGYLSWARPGDWLVRQDDRVSTVTDEHYRSGTAPCGCAWFEGRQVAWCPEHAEDED